MDFTTPPYFNYIPNFLPSVKPLALSAKKRVGIISLLLFALLFVGLPLSNVYFESKWISLFDTFYRVGALVFGGGHVVLPLLEKEVVSIHLVNAEQYLAGYGAAQAVPGPFFTFASYLGALIGGMKGVIVATVGTFLPSFLLIIGTLPFINQLREKPKFLAALLGINAAVVGILLAALYDPVFVSSIHTSTDFAVALILFALLSFRQFSPLLIVLLGAITGSIIT